MYNIFREAYWPTTFDELITFYPRFYRDVYEMVEILKTEGRLLDESIEGAMLMMKNLFVDTADEDTIRALERYLGISLYSTRTLEERRRIVRAFFTGFGKVSATSITETIRAYTGAEVECRFEPFDEAGNNRLYIYFSRGEEATLYYSDIIQILSRMIPAHIVYTAVVAYRFPVGVKYKRTLYKYGYDFSGTKPETILVGALHEVDAVTKTDGMKVLMNYHQAANAGLDPGSGRYPQTALLADHDIVDTATEVSPLSSGVDYIPCGTLAAHS